MKFSGPRLRAVLFMAAAMSSVLWAQDEKTSPPAVPAPPLAPSATKAAEAPAKPDSDGSRGWLAPGEDPQNRLGVPLLKHLAKDQETFWTTPAHFNVKDLRWIAPFAGITGVLIASDSWISKQVPPSQISRSKSISNYAVFSLVGVGGGSFLLGHMTGNDHLQETGLLTGEAAIDSTAAAYLFKEMTQRPRPYQGNGHGSFWQGGTSFPSEHSAVAWSVASVWAHEYPGTLSQMFAYGLASAVTVTRVTGKQHFASDAVIGGALGWYFGRQIFRAHHDPEVGGTSWGPLLPEHTGEHTRNPENMGSPYVPLDSWVYPALERLQALGYINSAYLGMRPWTRMECARLLDEASERISGDDAEDNQAARILNELSLEFAPETERRDGAANLGASVDSIYTRVTGISGRPLTDGYHFAQTIFNDYGRPYGQGFNDVTGVAAHAEAGPFSVFVQGEYQSAPAIASDPPNVLQAIALSEEPTAVLPDGAPAISRFRLLDSSVAFTFRNVQISFGQQSLWLGPSPGGPFLLSNNAEPIPMLRFDQVSPTRIPGISRILGPMRTEFAVGRLSGAHWIFAGGQLFGPSIEDQPFVHLEKVSFKPTANLEFGMGISSMWGGPEHPVTWKSFFKTFTIVENSPTLPGALGYPGDHRSTAEFSYRLPHLRDWITLYGDSLVVDEVSPIGSSRPSLREGLYLAKFPKVGKLDLRVEAVYTDPPHSPNVPGNIYTNGQFRSGYTNNGLIMGSWVGRAGKGGQAWATFWFSPQTTLQLHYRRQEVDPKFLQGGGLNDFGATAEIRARPDLSLRAMFQYEKWKFPVLAPTAQSNLTTSLQLTYYPRWGTGK